MPSATSSRDRDASGVDRRASLTRRLVASIIATAVFAATFSVFFLAASATRVVIAVYALLVPVSYVLERRWPGRLGGPGLVRYGLVGALFGWGVVGVVLEAPPTPGWTAMAITVGAVSGAFGVWAAAVVPARWLGPVGVLAATVVVAFGTIG